MIEWRKMTCFFWRKLKRESLDNVCWHSCLLYKLCWPGLCSDLTTSSSWIVWQALEDAQIFAHHAFDEDFFFGGGRVGAKTRGKLAHWRCHSRCDALCQHEGFEATRRRGRTRLEGQLRLVWDWYLVCEINGNRPFICRPARSSKINTFIIISTRLTGGHGLSYVDHPAGRHPWLVQDATHVKVESGVGEDRSAYWFHCHHSEHHATRSCRGPQNLLILRTSLFSPLASEKKLVCHVFQVIM